MARSVRMIVTSVDPTVVATEIESLEEKLNAGLLPDKLRSIVTAGFAILGVGLTSLGIFGIVGFDLSSRRQEIAIRMAIGANQQRLIAEIVSGSAIPVLSGIVVSTLSSSALARNYPPLFTRRDPLRRPLCTAFR